MNNTRLREDIIFFCIIYFIVICLSFFFASFYENYYYCGGPTPTVFFIPFLPSIPNLFFIRKGKTYSIIFSLYVLIFIWLFYLIQLKGEMMIWNRWEGFWLDAWEILFIINSIGIYFGIKIIIKQYLEYKKLIEEDKIKEKSFKEVIKRISYFFLSIISFFLILWFLLSTNLFDYFYDPYI